MGMGFFALISYRSHHPGMGNQSFGESLAAKVIQNLQDKMTAANGRFEDLNSNEQYIMGQFYHRGIGCEIHHRKAFRLTRISAISGNPLGQNALGVLLEDDPAQRIHWFHEAALQGLSFGQYHLARCLHDGEGVQPCTEDALTWYHTAAQQGLYSAQTTLGDIYFNGIGVQKNRPEAKKWYQLAALQGDLYAHDQVSLIEMQRR
jgi:uncharacterized protein